MMIVEMRKENSSMRQVRLLLLFFVRVDALDLVMSEIKR
jgi:hypothetical protein